MRKHNILLYTKDVRELSKQLKRNIRASEKQFWQATKSSKLDVIKRNPFNNAPTQKLQPLSYQVIQLFDK